MDKSSFNRNRYDRLYKLTGETEWLAKYAEEGVNMASKPYKFQTIAEFIEEFIDANNEPFEEDPYQGMLGGLAAKVVAAHWKKTQDLDADALKSIELSSKPAKVLADSLLKFTPKDFKEIKAELKDKLSNLEHKQAAVASKLDDEDLSNIIKFAIIRGTLYAYWTFVFRNPIVLIMLEGKHLPVSEAEFSSDQLVVEAAGDELVDLEQEDIELGDFDEGQDLSKKRGPMTKKDIENAKKKNQDRVYRERDIGKLPENYIPISQAIKALRLVRARHAHSISNDLKDAKLRANYAITDATIQFMQTLHASIQSYIAEKPERAGMMLSGQRLGGADGKGDILVATDQNYIGNMPGMFITSLRTGTYRNVTIPWVNHNKEGQVFSARKIAGPVIPSPGSIFPGFIAKKYKNFNAYSAEMVTAIVEDLKLLNDYNTKLGVKGVSKNSLSVIINVLSSESVAITEDETNKLAEHVWKIMTDKLTGVLSNASSASDIAKAMSSENGSFNSAFITEVSSLIVSSVPPKLMPENHDRFKEIVLSFLNDMKIVTNPDTVVSGFKPEILSTFSSSNVNPENNFKWFSSPEAAKELYQEASNMVASKVHEIDDKRGFHPDPLKGMVRDQKDYAIVLTDVTDAMTQKYSKHLKLKGDVPLDPNAIKKIVESAAYLLAPDAFSGHNSFGEGWLAVQYNGGGVNLQNYKSSLSPKTYAELERFAKYEVEEVSKETRDEFSKFLGAEYVESFTKKLLERMSKPNKKLETKLSNDLGLTGAEMAQFMGSGGNFSLLSPELVDKLKVAAGADYVKIKFQVMRQANFSRESAAWFTEVLGSGVFTSVDSKKFKVQTKENDMTSVRQKMATDVEKIYKEIVANPAAFGLPLKEDPVILSRLSKDESIKKENLKQYALLETIREWMNKFHSNDPENPRQKLLTHILNTEHLGPKYASNFTVNAIYEYIGQKYMTALTGIYVPMSWQDDEKKELVPLLQAATLKSFPSAKRHGGPQDTQDIEEDFSTPSSDDNSPMDYEQMMQDEFSGLSMNDDSDEFAQFRNPDSGDEGFSKEKGNKNPTNVLSLGLQRRQQAIEETEKWISHLRSKEAQFEMVEIRGITYTKRDPATGERVPVAKMTDEMKQRRGWSHLNPHTPGGWIQAVMGDSISPTIPYALKDLKSLIAYAKWAAAKSFGNRLNHVNQERAKASWSGPTAQFEDKWHLMEEVGAFADPVHSIVQLNKAFGDQEIVKRQSGYNADMADTAEKAFQRALDAVDVFDPKLLKAELQKHFAKKKADIIARFPQLKEKGLSNFVFEYRRIEGVSHNQNYTNAPYAKRGAKEMQRMFEFKGITAEQLEAAAKHMKLQSMKESLVSYADDIEEFSELEDLWNQDMEMFQKFSEISSWNIDSVEQIRDALGKVVPKDHPEYANFALKAIDKVIAKTIPSGEKASDFFKLTVEQRVAILQNNIDELGVEYHGLKMALTHALGEVTSKSVEAIKVTKQYYEHVSSADNLATSALQKAEEKRKLEREQAEKARLEEQAKNPKKDPVAEEKSDAPDVPKDGLDLSKPLDLEKEDVLVNQVMKEVSTPAVPVPQVAPAKPKTVVRRAPEVSPAPQMAPQTQPGIVETKPQSGVKEVPMANRPAPKGFIMEDDEDENGNMAFDGVFANSSSLTTKENNNTRHVWEDDDVYHIG